MKSFLVFLSIICLVTAPSLGADKYGGRGPSAVATDSSSTFDLGRVAGFPLDTVEVALHLNTSESVTYVENHITWRDTALTLLDVVPGAGLPDTLVFDLYEQTPTSVRFTFAVAESGYAAVPVGSEPIALLRFEVLCYGYGVSTPVTLFDDNNDNFYISGTLPAAPLRNNGAVTTSTQLSLLWNNGGESAYVAQQDIPFPMTFYQSTPGRLTQATFHFDDSQFEVDSVTALSGLEGGSVSISTNSGGELVVDVSTAILPPGQRDLFAIHFASLDDTDDIQSTVFLDAATRENACGDEMQPVLYDANITIPNHTASADLTNISPYYDADYFDVPVVMDSNHPINAYNLHVQFPADQIYFDRIVGHVGFTPAVGGVDTGDTTLVALINGTGTNYVPADLPATVFYLRFRPWTTPSAGTDFTVSFTAHQDNAIKYYTDLGAYHDADITSLGSATIHTISHGGNPRPCCPALWVWNGDTYQLDNNVLAECDGKVVDHDVTDYYRLTQPVVDDDGVLRFQVREDGNALSDFAGFELLAFDRPAGENVQVTRDGEIVVAEQPFAIQWARDDTGRDIKALIEAPDNEVYSSTRAGWFEVGLGTLTSDQIGKFAAETHDATSKDKDCPPVLKAEGLERKGRKLRVAVKAADGSWRTIVESDARHNPVRQSALITPEMIGEGRELVLRYSWESFYRIDVLEFSASRPYDGDVRTVPMIAAARTDDPGARLQPVGGAPLSLEPGEVIDVAFDGSDLPELRPGFSREYVFVSTGRYTEPGAGEAAAPERGFALDANHPNPFNPTTTIGYSLAAETHVDLKVYDVTGALVRTLVSGRQSAGEQSVVWDGLSDAGTPMASGVYFYRLQAQGFVQTRKMVLLK